MADKWSKIFLIGGAAALAVIANREKILDLQGTPTTSGIPGPQIQIRDNFTSTQSATGTLVGNRNWQIARATFAPSTCPAQDPHAKITFSQNLLATAKNFQMSIQHNINTSSGIVIQNCAVLDTGDSTACTWFQHSVQVWDLYSGAMIWDAERLTNAPFSQIGLVQGSSLAFHEQTVANGVKMQINCQQPGSNIILQSSFTVPNPIASNFPTTYPLGNMLWEELNLLSCCNRLQVSDGYYYTQSSGTVTYIGYKPGTTIQSPITFFDPSVSEPCRLGISGMSAEGSNVVYTTPVQQTSNVISQSFYAGAIGPPPPTCSCYLINIVGTNNRYQEIATVGVSYPGFTGTLSYALSTSPSVILGYIAMNQGVGSFQKVGVVGVPQTVIIEGSCSFTINF